MCKEFIRLTAKDLYDFFVCVSCLMPGLMWVKQWTWSSWGLISFLDLIVKLDEFMTTTLGFSFWLLMPRFMWVKQSEFTFYKFQCQYSKPQVWVHNLNFVWICNNDCSLSTKYVVGGYRPWNFTLPFTYNCIFGPFYWVFNIKEKLFLFTVLHSINLYLIILLFGISCKKNIYKI